MAVRNVSRDTQPQAGTAGIGIARILQSDKGLEDLFALLLRNPRPVVVNQDLHPAVAQADTQRHELPVACTVCDEIAQTAPESLGFQRQGHRLFHVQIDSGAFAPGIGDGSVDQIGEKCQLRLLASLAARKGEVTLDHPLHLLHILLETGDLRSVAQHGQFQLHASQGRPKVVTHTGQHGRALLDLPLDPLAHLDEGGGRLAHLVGTLRREVRQVAALAEAVGCLGKSGDRANLDAHDQEGDDEEHDRRPDHPHQEDIGGHAEQPLAADLQVQEAVAQIDLDLHILRQADGVDGETRPKALHQRRFQAFVQNRAKAWLHGDTQLAAGHHLRPQPEDMLAEGQCPLLRHFRRAEQADHHFDVTGQTLGQTPGGCIVMPVVEHPGGNHLQQHKRQQEDQHGAAKETARQQPFQRRQALRAPQRDAQVFQAPRPFEALFISAH